MVRIRLRRQGLEAPAQLSHCRHRPAQSSQWRLPGEYRTLQSTHPARPPKLSRKIARFTGLASGRTPERRRAPAAWIIPEHGSAYHAAACR